MLPLDDRIVELFGARFRDRVAAPAGSPLHVPAADVADARRRLAPRIGGRSWDLTATLTRAAGDEGVLYATGTENSGLSASSCRATGSCSTTTRSAITRSSSRRVEVPVGESVLTARFRRGDGRGGSLEVAVDGVDAGQAELPLFMRMMSSVGASVGYDHGSAVSTRYRAPFPFTGTLHAVEIQLLTRPAEGTAEAEARTEMARQ